MTPTGQRESIEAQHRRCLEHIREQALNLAGNMHVIANAIKEVEEKGGTIDIQRQIDFLTSTYARLLKDWGVTTHLQFLGARQHKKLIRRRL